MKTVQQVLRELDEDRIIDVYLYENPIEYDRHEYLLDQTVRDVREAVRNRLRQFIRRLKDMEITEPEDGHMGILYAHRTMDDGFGSQAFNLVHMDELLGRGVECENYAYEFSPQSEIMGFLVADTPMTQRYLYDLIADVLTEASFFGFEQEELAEKKAELEQSMKEVENGTAELRTWEELKAELENGDLPLDEESPDEEELRYAAMEAEWAYSRHSREKELTLIRESLLSERGGQDHV